MSFLPAKGNGRFVEIYPAMEHANRVQKLVLRGLTYRAATVVIDAAMLGEGCTEDGREFREIQKQQDEIKMA